MISIMWKWLTDNGTALGVILALLAVLPFFWGALQYILIKRAEDRRLRFTAFHDLIKKLVEPENPNEPMRLDLQIAVIYELRNFKDYYPVSLRILKGLKSDWASKGPPDQRARRMEELELTIKHIERRV